ncbi:MAG: tetratricopeptide repeat protein [Candidatus Eisenbacteria bacterium]
MGLSAVALTWLALAAPAARTQTMEPYQPRRVAIAPRPANARGLGTVMQSPDLRMGPLSQRPVPPLTPAQLEALGQARALRELGRLDAARDTLQRLLGGAPHHPLVLWDLAAVHRANGDWRAIEQLGRSERGATGDSLLLAQDYAEALEKLGRPRDAAEVALEAWIVADYVAPWADATITRLADAGVKGLDQKVRAAAAARPGRADLGRAAARLAWRAGDSRSALASLAALDQQHPDRTPERWVFAEEMLAAGSARDSAGALEALLDLTGDRKRDVSFRYAAARRSWAIIAARNEEVTGAPRLARALADRPPREWGNDLVIPIARGLRAAGLPADARKLLADAGGDEDPELRLERALDELRETPDGPALAALHELAPSTPEAMFRYAEALFYAGQPDSAQNWYGRMSRDVRGAYTGAAFERLYLIEDADPKTALPAFGRMAWEEWRGEPRRALAVAESLVAALPRGATWAQAAMAEARLREATGDGRGALEPLLAVADSLPGDRLAPYARQRAGDVLRAYYKDDARALDQYEECLARYPKAWNSAEVRRQVETMRHESRF